MRLISKERTQTEAIWFLNESLGRMKFKETKQARDFEIDSGALARNPSLAKHWLCAWLGFL